MHGSRWRREETGTSRQSPRGTGRLPPTLHARRSRTLQRVPDRAGTPEAFGEFSTEALLALKPAAVAAAARLGVACEGEAVIRIPPGVSCGILLSVEVPAN